MEKKTILKNYRFMGIMIACMIAGAIVGWFAPDVGRLINKATHVNRESATVRIVRFFTEQIKKLGVAHGNQKVECVIRIAHDNKQRGFLVAQSI